MDRWPTVGVVALGLTLVSGPAWAERPRTPLPKRVLQDTPGPHRTLVKFRDDARVRVLPSGRVDGEPGVDLEPLRELVSTRRLRLEPAFVATPSLLRLLERARDRSQHDQPDLLGLFEVVGASIEDARDLQALDSVEFVSRTALMPASPLDIAPPTPVLTEFQTYLGPDGVNATEAWSMGYRGELVRLADIEYAWFVEHEEWNEGTMVPEPGQTPDLEALEGVADGNHGTAVAGILIGGDNAYGVTGISSASVLGVYPEFTIEAGSRRPEAILSAAEDSAAGDIILLEMQTGDGITGLLGPAELDESVWMATRVATDAGVVVVAAAGNGGLDLDREELAYYRNRGDSGAIIVGAGQPTTRARLGFSTYGDRVDVQGWGQGVFTTGYGQHAIYGEDRNQSYTATFSGTSSASPIVAGVAALVQDAVKAEGGQPLTSQQLRTVLRGTGLPQPDGDSGLIGPLPQAPEAIAAALVPPTSPPSVEITSPQSVQTEDSTLSTSIEISASDDTASVQLAINGELQPVVDAVPPFVFSNVDFPSGTWEVVAVATNVWDVEGMSAPVTLEVGYEPPATTSGTDASSSGDVGGGTEGATGDDAASTGEVPPVDTMPTGSSSGSGAGATSSGGGGCRTGGPAPVWLSSIALLVLVRRRDRTS